MRHSDPKLTANAYVDPQLLDVRAALDVLPAIPLDPHADHEARPARAIAGEGVAYSTWSDASVDPRSSMVPPLVPPTLAATSYQEPPGAVEPLGASCEPERSSTSRAEAESPAHALRTGPRGKKEEVAAGGNLFCCV